MTQPELMVKTLAEQFQNKGLEILYAKCDGYKDPTEVRGVTPDIVGWDPEKELYHLGIVADNDSVSTQIIQEKMRVLSNMMMGVGSSEGQRLPFYIGITKDASNTVDQKLEENKLTAQGNITKTIV